MDRSAGGRRFGALVERLPSVRAPLVLFGIQKRDKNIYLPCVGWIVLNGAVIAGAVVYG
jgi:hypothetical protein